MSKNFHVNTFEFFLKLLQPLLNISELYHPLVRVARVHPAGRNRHERGESGS